MFPETGISGEQLNAIEHGLAEIPEQYEHELQEFGYRTRAGSRRDDCTASRMATPHNEAILDVGLLGQQAGEGALYLVPPRLVPYVAPALAVQPPTIAPTIAKPISAQPTPKSQDPRGRLAKSVDVSVTLA